MFFFSFFFAELLSSARFAASASFSLFSPLRYKSKDTSTRSAPLHIRANAPVRVNTAPERSDEIWTFSSAFLLFGLVKGFEADVSVSSSTLWSWLPPFFFLGTAERRMWTSNERCYDWANDTGMADMQSRNRCKVRHLLEARRRFILTSLDEAEELEAKDGAPSWSHSLLYISLQPHPLFFCHANFLVSKQWERVFLSARQQEMVERIRCMYRLCAFQSAIPISSIWGVCVCSVQLLHSRSSAWLQVTCLEFCGKGVAFKVANFLRHQGWKCACHRLLLNTLC